MANVTLEFAKEVSSELNENGFNTEPITVEKNNNTTLVGIRVVFEDRNVAPCIYLTDKDVEAGVDTTVEMFSQRIPTLDVPAFDVEAFTKWDEVSDKLRIRLVNGSNAETLTAAGIVNRPVFGDLLIYSVVNVAMSDGDNGFVKVDESLIKLWGVDADEVFSIALANSNKETSSSALGDVLAQIGAFDDMDEIPDMSAAPFDVLSNTEKAFGASALLNADFLKKYPADFYAIPSSVHEVLILANTDNSVDPEALKEMICEVNETTVMPDEVLSDHPYHFVNGVFVAA